MGGPQGQDDVPSAAREGMGIGSRLAGYHVLEQAGRGGMAVVFRARDERLGRIVALKVLSPALAADAEFRQRFIRECRAAAAVDHPHILPVYEAGSAGGVLFMAMRYVSGGDVHSRVRLEGPLAPGRAAAMVSPVASALDAAHAAGLVHRDVKPANMLLDAQPGRPDHVYLSDFGLSKATMSSARLTSSGAFLGTPDYAAPEQIAGVHLDGSADQYALACTAFELLSGSPPFQRDHAMAVVYAQSHEPPPPLSSRSAGLTQEVDRVMARALAKDPADRYPTCRDFAEAFRSALGFAAYDAESPMVANERNATAGADPPLHEPVRGATGLPAEIVVSSSAPAAPDPDSSDTGEKVPVAVPAEGSGISAHPDTGKPDTTRPKRLRKRLLSLVAAFAVGLVVLAGAYVLRYSDRSANYTGSGSGNVAVRVLRNDTVDSLASRLVRLGVIKAADPFIAAAKDGPGLVGLAPGYFWLHKHMNAKLAYRLLLEPSSRVHFAMIPAGLDLKQTLSELATQFSIPVGAFAKAARQISALGLPAYARSNSEGYLFPATYPIEPGASAISVLRAMVARFKQEAARIKLLQDARAMRLTGAQIVAVASLLQAQGADPKYYAKMARVIYNRLHDNMKLELDSTVLYALRTTHLPITAAQIRVKSPYNTFLHSGLPSGPINNPSAAALNAALHPTSGKWLYFVTVNPKTGLTKFTSSQEVFAQLQAKLGGKLDLSCLVTNYPSPQPGFLVTAEIGSGGAYIGTVTISFVDAIGRQFPPTSLTPDVIVTYSTPWNISQPVPSADVGADAQPSICTASAAG